MLGLGLLVAGVVVFGSIADDDETETPAAEARPSLRSQMLDVCPVFSACGIEADTIGPPYTFSLLPESTEDGVLALGVWAGVTGCLESVDFSRIEQTRALDGMVSSANGRSTWTYHPDAGLTIVCG